MSDTIIAFISGAVVAGISSWLANFYSERRDRRKEFNEAAKKFRSNFTDELKLLKRHGLGDDSGNITSHILSSAIEKHETAMINFRPYLNRVEKNRFDNAWRIFALDDDVDGGGGGGGGGGGWEASPSEAIHKYYSYENTLIELKMRKLAIASIKLLLTFAKSKNISTYPSTCQW